MAKRTKNLNKFDSFCEVCFTNLDADKRAEITSLFMTDEVKKILEDKELLDSIVNMLKNNLNISVTSRNTFVHRNTILYRIDKIYKATGLDLREFEDAAYFRFLLWLKSKDNGNN